MKPGEKVFRVGVTMLTLAMLLIAAISQHQDHQELLWLTELLALWLLTPSVFVLGLGMFLIDREQETTNQF